MPSLLLIACAGSAPSNLTQRQAMAADTPMMQAISRGDFERVEALAASGVSINTLTEQGTPLEAAVGSGEDRITWFLLSEGAAPDRANTDGTTPLMIAAADGRRRLVRLLLTAEMLVAAGADVNYRNEDGLTALGLARAQNNRDLELLLIQSGAEL